MSKQNVTRTLAAILAANVPEDRRIVFRVGINLGEVIVEGEDIHGDDQDSNTWRIC